MQCAQKKYEEKKGQETFGIHDYVNEVSFGFDDFVGLPDASTSPIRIER